MKLKLPSLVRFKNFFLKTKKALIGDIRWTKPAWTRAVNQKTWMPLKAVKKERPRLFWSGLAGLVLLGSLSAGIYHWYTHRPQPTYVTVNIHSPFVTPYAEKLIPDSLRFTFNASVARLDEVDKPVARGVTMTPAVEGKWQWQGDRVLTFHPANDWPAGQKYAVRFAPDFFPDQVLLEKLDYEFETPRFTGQITKAYFHQDPTNPKIKTVEAILRFTYPIDTAGLESELSLIKEYDGKTTPSKFTLGFDNHKREVYVHSATLTPLEQDSFMKILLKSAYTLEGRVPLEGKVEGQVKIPSMFTFFHVDGVSTSTVRNEKYDPEQVLVVKVTDGALASEVVKGLKVYLLPVDKPAGESDKEIKNYQWTGPREVTPEILALSTPVELTAIPADKEYATLHSFKYRQSPGRFLYVKVEDGIRSFGGYVLSQKYDSVLRTAAYPKELSIMGSGALLSLNGERKVSLVSRGLKGVKQVFYRIASSQINDLVSQSEGDFSNPYFNNYSFNEDNISEVFSETVPLDDSDPSKAQYQAVDFGKHLEAQKGLFILKVNDWDPATDSSSIEYDTRMILVTDLGLIVKDNADGSHEVFVQSLQDGSPVAGARVQVLGKNGQPVASATTDGTGSVSLPNVSDLEREKKPVAYVVTKNDDASFIPYKQSARRLDLSKYDIGGIEFGGQDRLQAYVFSDRGIYRPGEKIQAGIVVKSTDWKQDLKDVPLEVVITDPRAMTVQKQRVSLTESGFLEASYQTEEASAAGNYNIYVYIAKDNEEATLLGSTAVRVEDFLPDQMKIVSRFSKETNKGWLHPDELKGQVTLNNLYGTPATDRRVTAKLTLSAAFPSFADYKEFSFYNPLKFKEGLSENLEQQKTNEAGEAEFDFRLERYSKATYRLEFQAQGFAAQGGRGVKAESSVLISPLNYLIGTKSDGELRFLKKNSDHVLKFIAIDPALKPVPVEGLKAKLIEKRYVSALIQESNGTYRYQSVLKEIQVSEKDFAIAGGGLDFPLDTRASGDFEIRVFQNDGTQVSLVNYAVAGDDNLTRSLDKSAELQITLDKEMYSPGDEIEISIKAPYAGAGLITLERDKIYAREWFKSPTTATVQKIRIPADFEGNGYVNIAFTRAKDSKEIFMSPLSYGVVPFSLSLEKRTEAVEITCPELVKPGDDVKISYKTAHPSKIVIYAVDEGIIQYAGHPSPDPLADFFEKRALEVKTSQTLDQILPEYSLYRNTSSPGGDQGYKLTGNNLNPFKRKTDPPVVFWSGILDASQSEQQLSFPIPDYFNGGLKVVAMAVADETVGVTEKSIKVRGPFVMSPTAPLFVAPGDQFEVSLTLANNVAGSGQEAPVELTVNPSAGLEIIGEKTQKLKISEMTEKSAVFKVRAKGSPGAQELTFNAGGGGESARMTTTLSIRPATPFMTRIQTGSFKSGSTEVNVNEELYPEHRVLEATVSPLPVSLSKGLLRYLENYPYGCTEQLISKAFPVLALKGVAGFDVDAEKTNKILNKTLHQLRARQNPDGSFVYWPALPVLNSEEDQSADEGENDEGEEEENDEENEADNGEGGGYAADPSDSAFATIYALHFLTEAKEMGQPVPPDLLSHGLTYLKKFLGVKLQSREAADLYGYAVYVLTRNGEVTSNYLANLRDFLDRDDADGSDKTWKTDLVGTYVAAVYKLLKQDDAASELIGQYKSSEQPSDWYYTGQRVSDAQYFYLISKHFAEKLPSMGASMLPAILEPLFENRYSTLYSSYATLALQAYSMEAAKIPAENLKIEEITDDKTVPLSLIGAPVAAASFSGEARKLRFSGKSSLPIYYQAVQSGFDLKLPDTVIKEGLEIQREIRNAKGEVVVDAVPIGSELTVHLKLRSIDADRVSNIVVVDLLPGGFDLDNPEILLSGQSSGGNAVWSPEYVDAREDRVLLFGSIGTDAQEFVYRIKATSIGEFQVPGIFVESMYDLKTKARDKGSLIRVVGGK